MLFKVVEKKRKRLVFARKREKEEVGKKKEPLSFKI